MLNNTLYSNIYTPDVLSCLANLSNDEVFTPPEIANKMLDLLPQELFASPETKFLDPACKSGVFLREIAKRLLRGLEPVIPDLRQRVEHIFQRQLYGIAITELTSLLSRRSVYCSKYPNGTYSVAGFADAQGNIRFGRTPHRWKDGRCQFCGASQGQYERGELLETHAYAFIHTTRPEEIFDMKFDVIIGNPPYQLSDGGAQASAKPIYNLFVDQAKKLKPRYLVMVIPARWYSGGKGLDIFRRSMLEDRKIRVLHDFQNASDCFPNVEIKGGVCYFLWARDYEGMCDIFNHNSNGIESRVTRNLLEENCSTFIRFNEAISILRKIQNKQEKSFEEFVSSRKPFGFPTDYRGHKVNSGNDVMLFENNGLSFVSKNEIPKGLEYINEYKVFISRAYGAGEDFPHQILNKPFIGNKNTCCTETYLLIGPYRTESIARNVIAYISTKFFRFLVLLIKNTQDATSKVYRFVPIQDFSKPWTDAELYAKYGLTDEEIAFIESMVKPMDLNGGADDAE